MAYISLSLSQLQDTPAAPEQSRYSAVQMPVLFVLTLHFHNFWQQPFLGSFKMDSRSASAAGKQHWADLRHNNIQEVPCYAYGNAKVPKPVLLHSLEETSQLSLLTICMEDALTIRPFFSSPLNTGFFQHFGVAVVRGRKN